jgi:hypothetical protein
MYPLSVNVSKERCNYDKSKFIVRDKKELEAIAGSNEKILEILNGCYNMKESIDEYVKLKVFTKEKLADETILGQIIRGSKVTGIENARNDYPQTNGKPAIVEETNTTAGISSEEEDFMNNL